MTLIRFAGAILALAIVAAGTPLGRADAATNQVIEMPNGLKYTDTKTGDGATAAPGNKVSVHYTGWLIRQIASQAMPPVTTNRMIALASAARMELLRSP